MKNFYLLMLCLLGVAGVSRAQTTQGPDSEKWSELSTTDGVIVSHQKAVCATNPVFLLKIENTSAETRQVMYVIKGGMPGKMVTQVFILKPGEKLTGDCLKETLTIPAQASDTVPSINVTVTKL